MTKKGKIILWSVIGAVTTLTVAGVFIFWPGRKKGAPAPVTPGSTTPGTLPVSPASVVQKATSAGTNINLRSSPSSKSSANLVATIAKSGTLLGTIIGSAPDADGAKYTWYQVQPDNSLSAIIDYPFYIRQDLIKIS